jgi:hypothetical protein
VSGTLINALVEVAGELLGSDVVDTGFGNAGHSGILGRGALPGTWIPLVATEEAFESLARAAGRDLPSLHVELARVSIDRALRRFWKLLLKLTSDEALISRSPVIFARSYNRGRLVSSIPEPGVGEVRLLDWPDAPEWVFRGTHVGIEAALSIAGRKDVRAEGRRTPTGAIYAVTWRR